MRSMRRAPADPRVLEVAKAFLREVEGRLGDKLVAVVAYGSRVWGGYSEDSDYDLLLVHRASDREAEEAAADAALKVSAELGVGVEPIAVSVYEVEGGDKLFIAKGLEEGLAIYPDGGAEEARRREAIDLIMLADEFLDTARLLLDHGRVRGAIDAAYNAAELAVKALLLWDGYEPPRSHGGLVAEFARLYVLTGQVDSALGRGLSLALERRSRARYDVRAEFRREDVEGVLSVAEGLIELAKRRVAGSGGGLATSSS